MNFKTFVEAILYAENNKSDATGGSITEQTLYNEVQNWTKLLSNTPSFLAHIIPCKFIYDFSKAEMTWFSPSVQHVLGYDASAFTGANGIIKFMDIINPNDFIVYNEQIFPKDMSYLSSLPYEDTIGMTFSNNLRMRQSSGLYKTLLLKKCFITVPETKHLLFEIGILIDISSIKKELSITHTIERVYQAGEVTSLIKVITEDYFPEMHENILSGREKEILSHLSKGTKRKEVGVQLFISDNTVANHIKTILRKTNSQNIREAIAVCKMNGII